MRPFNRWVRKVKVYPFEQVTQINFEEEIPPQILGVSPEIIPNAWRRVQELYQTGMYPALGFTLRYKGHLLMDRTIGHAQGNAPYEPDENPKILATPKTLFGLFSASKAVTAMAVHLLIQRKQLNIDERIAEYIPEFAQFGKGYITIRHLLNHTAGIPNVEGENLSLDLLSRWDEIIKMICLLQPETSAVNGGFIIGEIVKRITGKDIQTFLRDEIFRPIGLETFRYGVPEQNRDNFAQNAMTGYPVPTRFRKMFQKSLGFGLREITEFSNDPRYLSALIPSANVYCTSDEACRFMQFLSNGGELNGVQIFEPHIIREATKRQGPLQRDSTIQLPLRYGLGFMLGGDVTSIYGDRTPKAFGHLGFTNVVLYTDPERQISVSIMNSGKALAHPGVFKWLGLMRYLAKVFPRIKDF